MDIALLKKLCCTFGVSGREEAVREEILQAIDCDETETDRAGNLICMKKSKRKNAPVVALDAHMDSVGLCVKEVCTDGFLKFTAVGGIDERILPAASVMVFGEKPVFGVIATKPPHLMEKADKENPVSIDKMLIDTGNNAGNISVGDRICYAPAFQQMLRSVSGTYLDNRAGCAAIIEVFRKLKGTELPFDLAGVFSTGEESGLKGAKSSNFKADIALVLDVTFGKTPDELSDEALLVGGGAAIGTGPNVHKAIQKGLQNCAEKRGILWQPEVLEGCSGTNAWSYQTQGLGIPCGMLSFPLKYMHTPVETMRISDYDAVVELTAAYLSALQAEEIQEIAGEKKC